MGKLSKQILARYIDSECERNLFLALGEDDPNWLNPCREIKKSDKEPRRNQLLFEMGAEYEQKVYKTLRNLPHVEANWKSSNVTRSTLNKNKLIFLYNKLVKNPKDIHILLEYQFVAQNAIFNELFNSPQRPFLIKNVKSKLSDLRPDIITIGNPINLEHNSQKPVKELLPDQTVREIRDSELATRFGINIIDIKNTNRDKISKKHFIEILYYMWALSVFLKEIGLEKHFYVNIDNNGILYSVDKISQNLGGYSISSVQKMYEYIMPLSWEEAYRLFTKTLTKVRKLWDTGPHKVEDIPLFIQPGCGFCSYIFDCLETLGYNSGKSSDQWALELIPYLSPSIAQQLKAKGYSTIKDVSDTLQDYPIGVVPEAIYPEIPLLKLKTESLLKGQVIHPLANQLHTYCLPKYSPINLTFCVEADPIHERVLGIALQMSISASPKMPYCLALDNWWRVWKGALDIYESNPDSFTDVNLGLVQEELNTLLFELISEEDIQEFWTELLNSVNEMEIYLPGDLVRKNTTKHALITYDYTIVNNGLSDREEMRIGTEFINRSYSILKICHIIEKYVKIKNTLYEGAIGFIAPDMAIFYWGTDQLRNLQALMERTYEQVLVDPIISIKFSQLVSWFNPSDSEVSHPYQHKKTYNLQRFAETVFGFPSVINYTWHDLAQKLLNMKKPNPFFWIPHFNYMDFQFWHNYLRDIIKVNNYRAALKNATSRSDIQKIKSDLKDRIEKRDNKRQSLIWALNGKVRTLNRLRMYFQKYGRDQISKYSAPIETAEYINTVDTWQEYHPIAQIWYMFSKLNGTMDEFEKESFRTTFPEFAIGKLAAGKVTNLKITKRVTAVPKKKDKIYFTYDFYLIGLSSNMKIKELDRVLLIPDPIRDLKAGKGMMRWEITIEEMEYDPIVKGFHIKSKETSADFQENYKQMAKFYYPNPQWYIYPVAFDAWSNKLAGPRGLFNQYDFGTTWLGYHLANAWGVKSFRTSPSPLSWDFNTPEIYMFAPNLLLVNRKKTSSSQLTSPIFPPPDDSQKLAIVQALDQIIYGIQGPPGTGKSQTIATLIDEFTLRQRAAGNKNRILITAFSYAAIGVLIDKIRQGKYPKNQPSASSHIQMVYIHSESQEEISPRTGLKSVDNVIRKGSTWKWNGENKSITPTHKLEKNLEDEVIIFANAHALFNLRKDGRVEENFCFDLIISDEASQLPTDYFMASLQYVKKLKLSISPDSIQFDVPVPNDFEIGPVHWRLEEPITPQEVSDFTKVVIVGDFNQLPPIQQIDPPKNLEILLDSLFTYYVRHHQISNSQLKINYRSNEDIVNFTNFLGLYQGLIPFTQNINRRLKLSQQFQSIGSTWIREVLDSQKSVEVLVHTRNFEIAVSPFEAEIVSKLVLSYYKCADINSDEDELEFWEEKLGVVSPHNAQGRLIVNLLYQVLTQPGGLHTYLSPDLLIQKLYTSIYSVEKFQGSDRELIVASIGISDNSQLKAEEEFIFDVNRFNVLTSRAKSKIILVCSQNFLDYIPKKPENMIRAAKSRLYSYQYCNCEKILFIPNEKHIIEPVRFRFHQSALSNVAPVHPMWNQVIKSAAPVSSKKFSIEYYPTADFTAYYQELSDVDRNLAVLQDDGIYRLAKNLKDLPNLVKIYPVPPKIAALQPTKKRIVTTKSNKHPPDASVPNKNKKPSKKSAKSVKIRVQKKKDDLW